MGIATPQLVCADVLVDILESRVTNTCVQDNVQCMALAILIRGCVCVLLDTSDRHVTAFPVLITAHIMDSAMLLECAIATPALAGSIVLECTVRHVIPQWNALDAENATTTTANATANLPSLAPIVRFECVRTTAHVTGRAITNLDFASVLTVLRVWIVRIENVLVDVTDMVRVVWVERVSVITVMLEIHAML